MRLIAKVASTVSTNPISPRITAFNQLLDISWQRPIQKGVFFSLLHPTRRDCWQRKNCMNNTLTVILGIVAMLLPLVVGRLYWKRFDHYFGRGDEVYMDSLEFFLKKIGSTVLIAFIILWIGISLVFNGSAS